MRRPLLILPFFAVAACTTVEAPSDAMVAFHNAYASDGVNQFKVDFVDPLPVDVRFTSDSHVVLLGTDLPAQKMSPTRYRIEAAQFAQATDVLWALAASLTAHAPLAQRILEASVKLHAGTPFDVEIAAGALGEPLVNISFGVEVPKAFVEAAQGNLALLPAPMATLVNGVVKPNAIAGDNYILTLKLTTGSPVSSESHAADKYEVTCCNCPNGPMGAPVAIGTAIASNAYFGWARPSSACLSKFPFSSSGGYIDGPRCMSDNLVNGVYKLCEQPQQSSCKASVGGASQPSPGSLAGVLALLGIALLFKRGLRRA